MARLPQPGGDNGNWGDILNDYLSQSHKSDGSIKDNAVAAAQIQDGSITETQLHSDVQTKLNASSVPAWADITGKPSVIGAGASQSAARSAIGATTVDEISEIFALAPEPGTASANTAAIQVLIDQASTAGGGIVQLRNGKSYTVTGLIMKSNVTLDLQGGTLQLASSTTASVIETLDYSTLKAGDTTGGPMDFSIINGFLDGNKAGQSGTPSSFPAVLAIYGRRYTLDNLIVRNGQGTGIDSQWSTISPFQAPNGFESWVSRVYVHSCRYDGINFRGPHDTFFQNFFVVKCGEEAGSVPLRFPDSSGRANGCNVDKFHIYGGNGHNYCLLVNTAGMRFSNFVCEGAQVAQVLVQASQVMLDGFHLYTGGIAMATAKGIQMGDSTHTGVNGSTIRGRVENCGGGAIDVTYMGWNNDVDLHHFYLSSTTPTKTDLGYVGTLVARNQFRLRTTDSGSGSGGTYLPTSGQVSLELGPRRIVRSNSSDTVDLWQLRDETNTVLSRVDWRGRRRVVASGPIPTIAAGANIGTGGTVALSGDDTAGTITITVGTSPDAGTLATVTFSGVFGNTPHVILSPSDAISATLNLYTARSTSSFSVRCVGTPVATNVYTVCYQVVGA